MENMMQGSPEHTKLTSELLMALEKHIDKYDGIERKRLEVQIREYRKILVR